MLCSNHHKISIEECEQEEVESLTKCGVSVVSTTGGSDGNDEEVSSRISKARIAFSSLKRICNSKEKGKGNEASDFQLKREIRSSL